MASGLRTAIKTAMAPILYRYPPFGLKPERLAVYLQVLLETAPLGGDVAEIGCNVGGTAIVARQALRGVGWTGTYTCFDTFGGFVKEQFDRDAAKGTKTFKRDLFSNNSKALVRKVTAQHGCGDIQLAEGDATRLDPASLSRYAVVLADIDLSDPTYEVMKLFWPRVLPGGYLLVDDCVENRHWLAKEGYQQFCRENGLAEAYRYGLGILAKPAGK